MFLVNIGAMYEKDNVINYILYRLNKAKSEGLDIKFETNDIDKVGYIVCTMNENILSSILDKNLHKDFNYQISEIIADLIIYKWEERLIKKLIKKKYFYLTEKERNHLKHLTSDNLIRYDSGILQGGIYKATRKTLIMRLILDYLNTSNTIMIDGFVKFRLGSYYRDLEESLDHAFESYLAEREYKEFIKLLKYFVDIQECKIDVIHIKPLQDGRYSLLDSDFGQINSEYFDELRNEILDTDINNDDILISTLITIAPRKIIIHDIERFTNKELIKTIGNVFVDRVIICSGCNLCETVRVEKELNKI